MNISLTRELEGMVHARVQSGLYHSASEVVREALRLFFRQQRRREHRALEVSSQGQDAGQRQ